MENELSIANYKKYIGLIDQCILHLDFKECDFDEFFAEFVIDLNLFQEVNKIKPLVLEEIERALTNQVDYTINTFISDKRRCEKTLESALIKNAKLHSINHKEKAEFIRYVFDPDKYAATIQMSPLKFGFLLLQASIDSVFKHFKAVNEMAVVSSTSESEGEIDPEMWNKECYLLFMYLERHFSKSSKHKYVYIWFYLREFVPSNRSIYGFYANRDRYSEFVKSKFGIVLTNWNRSDNYFDNIKPTLDRHRTNYETSLK